MKKKTDKSNINKPFIGHSRRLYGIIKKIENNKYIDQHEKKSRSPFDRLKSTLPHEFSSHCEIQE